MRRRSVSPPIGLALGIAWTGQWIHDFHFLPATFGFGAAAIPWLLLAIGLYVYWRVSSGGVGSLLTILVYALVGLVGAIVTVLPLSVLPFEPEQTLGHYLAHTIFALAQIPAIAIVVRQLGRLESRSPVRP